MVDTPTEILRAEDVPGDGAVPVDDATGEGPGLASTDTVEATEVDDAFPGNSSFEMDIPASVLA